MAHIQRTRGHFSQRLLEALELVLVEKGRPAFHESGTAHNLHYLPITPPGRTPYRYSTNGGNRSLPSIPLSPDDIDSYPLSNSETDDALVDSALPALQTDCLWGDVVAMLTLLLHARVRYVGISAWCLVLVYQLAFSIDSIHFGFFIVFLSMIFGASLVWLKADPWAHMAISEIIWGDAGTISPTILNPGFAPSPINETTCRPSLDALSRHPGPNIYAYRHIPTIPMHLPALSSATHISTPITLARPHAGDVFESDIIQNRRSNFHRSFFQNLHDVLIVPNYGVSAPRTPRGSACREPRLATLWRRQSSISTTSPSESISPAFSETTLVELDDPWV